MMTKGDSVRHVGNGMSGTVASVMTLQRRGHDAQWVNVTISDPGQSSHAVSTQHGDWAEKWEVAR